MHSRNTTSVAIRKGPVTAARRARPLVALVVGMLASALSTSSVEARQLSMQERLAAQRAIEQVYWNHRIWPKENPGPKPPLSAVLSDDALRARVQDTLRKSNALEKFWQRRITAEQLQAEMNRMAVHTHDPQVLRELFAALGNDPVLIAETLARQSLADRLIHDWYSSDERFHGDLRRKAEAALAACPDVGCMESLGGEYRETTWRLDSEEVRAAPADARRDVVTLQLEEWKAHLDGLATAVGGVPDSLPLRKVGVLEATPDAFVVTAVLSQGKHEVRTAAVAWQKVSFDDWWETERPTLAAAIQEGASLLTLPRAPSSACAADTWKPTAVPSIPMARLGHTAVWTGTEMIVWGGFGAGFLNTGGRYDLATDTWTPTSTGANVPDGRIGHTVVWTGTEMIVWGGEGYIGSTGGRYDPATDEWTPTSTGTNVPSARAYHTAVWTGTEMIVWGGNFGDEIRTSGGRYDPSTDTWTPTSTGTNVPAARSYHTAVWTGTEMIVWGGLNSGFTFATGGRYDPFTDTWTPTSTGANVPSSRYAHTAVWTGTEMIVWGGGPRNVGNTGGRYDPSTDTWDSTSTGANVPAAGQG